MSKPQTKQAHPGNTSNPRESQFPASINPLIQEAQEAFRRDLTELLAHRGRRPQWVAYHGSKRIAVGASKTELYQECLRQGLKRGEFIVRLIEPEVAREADFFPDI